MKRSAVQILFGPSEMADLLGVPEATVNAVVLFHRAPKPTRTLNGKHLKWKQSDVPAWLRAIDSFVEQGMDKNDH